MKGRDLIEAIQKHGLEDYDFPICGTDGIFVGYISIVDAGHKYKVPLSAIRIMIREKKLNTVTILNNELVKEDEAEAVLSEYTKNHVTNTLKWKERRNNEFKRKRAN